MASGFEGEYGAKIGLAERYCLEWATATESSAASSPHLALEIPALRLDSGCRKDLEFKLPLTLE
jgi:hypothetical protein